MVVFYSNIEDGKPPEQAGPIGKKLNTKKAKLPK